ncbi:eukaryotic elongation factor 2 kinase-related [Anaeramoeba flamelloides]|uniref:Eukaryotic elongation factor 2 kinase-related n=1 Tax=Anaeramoeba flamelloides TaxID=1746091 RepID=A0ABQ8XKF9_9EUKA|nr:eukaryotic elongation factor 2 kinase-related [Anaeramoeba flamelloides]
MNDTRKIPKDFQPKITKLTSNKKKWQYIQKKSTKRSNKSRHNRSNDLIIELLVLVSKECVERERTNIYNNITLTQKELEKLNPNFQFKIEQIIYDTNIEKSNSQTKANIPRLHFSKNIEEKKFLNQLKSIIHTHSKKSNSNGNPNNHDDDNKIEINEMQGGRDTKEEKRQGEKEERQGEEGKNEEEKTNIHSMSLLPILKKNSRHKWKGKYKIILHWFDQSFFQTKDSYIDQRYGIYMEKFAQLNINYYIIGNIYGKDQNKINDFQQSYNYIKSNSKILKISFYNNNDSSNSNSSINNSNSNNDSSSSSSSSSNNNISDKHFNVNWNGFFINIVIQSINNFEKSSIFMKLEKIPNMNNFQIWDETKKAIIFIPKINQKKFFKFLENGINNNRHIIYHSINNNEFNYLEFIIKSTNVKLSKNSFIQGKIFKFHYLNQSNFDYLLIAKIFKNDDFKQNLIENFKLIKSYTIANMFANLFNKMSQKKLKIEFHPAFIYSIQSNNIDNYFMVEPFFYNNNKISITNPKFLDLINAFQHFVYHYSQKTMIIPDLQLIQDKFLSPHIQSTKKYNFGRKDLGKDGMNKIIKNHTCNYICKTFDFSKMKKIKK